MKRLWLVVLGSIPLCGACQGTPSAGGPAAIADQSQQEGAAGKGDEKKQLRKELRSKERELEALQVEQQVAQLDRRVREWSVQAALDKTAADVAAARTELEAFLRDVRPRELEERKLGLDGATYDAEHSKDEYEELQAMYQADEFARMTKELVLKRGRRSLEMAERRLSIQKRENAHFETVELPERERQLRRKLADAELEHRKAEVEAEKARLELALAGRKAAERAADLAEEIAELREKLGKGAP
jgi:hypothetical protein